MSSGLSEVKVELSPAAEEIQRRRLERMAAGQDAFDVVNLLSDPEYRIALVPLLEGEHRQALAVANAIQAYENATGQILRDRVQEEQILLRSCRDITDPTVRLFRTQADIDILDAADISWLMDHYLEMIANYSPKIDEITVEQQESLKKVFSDMDMNELSGRQWYAYNRFLRLISVNLLQDRSLSSGSILPSTVTNDWVEPVPSVEES